MAKRFTDTELWNKDWFQKLAPVQKCLYQYLCSACDSAGVWDTNFRMVSFVIGSDISETDILAINEDQERILKLENGKFFIVDFIPFQYGELSQNCKPHIPVFKSLEKNNIPKGYVKGIHTLKEKEKEQEKDKEKEKDKRDPFICPEIEKVFEIYTENCNNLSPLGFEKRSKDIRLQIIDFLEEINDNYEYFKEVCQKASILKEIAGHKIDLKMILNNHIGISNGKYETESQVKIDKSKLNFD